MGKYVNNQQYTQRPKRTGDYIAEGFAQGLQNFAEAYVEGKQREKDRELIEKMSDPNLTEMDKAQIALQLSPQGQKAVMTAMDLYYKLQHQKELQQRHEEELDVRRQREGRLGQEHGAKELERLYKSRLSTIKDQLKDARSAEIKPLREEQAALQKELGQNLARIKRGESPRFSVLQIEEPTLPAERQGFDTMNQMGGAPNVPGATPPIRDAGISYTPNAPQNTARNATALRQQPPQAELQQGGTSINVPQIKPQRVRWNPQDPAHQARALEILDAAKGDRAAANQALAEEFER